MNNRRFTTIVGKKFHEDGSVRTYPGNTIICMLDPASRIFAEMIKVRDMLLQMPDADKFTFLPPSSYHMTIFRGLNDQVRRNEYWSKYVPIDAPLEYVDKMFMEKLSEIHVPESFSMVYNYLEMGAGIGVHLAPEKEDDMLKIKDFRDEVSEQFGVRFPDHDHYSFHISLAYKIYELTDTKEMNAFVCKNQVDHYLRDHFGVYRSSSPLLMFFNDMFKFSQQRSLL